MAGRFSGKRVLVTGASSGIGAALAREFAGEGAQVALAARRTERLGRLREELVADGGEALALYCDVTRRETIDAALATMESALGGVDVVVVNAGFGVSGDMTRLETVDYRRQFETNVFGAIDTVYAALPYLERSRGQLALVASVMGRVGLPASAPYCASKFAVVGFGESIYYDLRERGIAVTLLDPGIVVSEFRGVDNEGRQTGRPDPAPKWLAMPTDQAARAMVRAIHRRTPEYVVTRHGQFVAAMARHFPRTTRLLVTLGSRGRLERIEAAKRGKTNQTPGA